MFFSSFKHPNTMKNDLKLTSYLMAAERERTNTKLQIYIFKIEEKEKKTLTISGNLIFSCNRINVLSDIFSDERKA